MALLTQTRALMSDACRSPLAARHAHHARFEPGAMSNEPIIGPVVIFQYIVPEKGEKKILVKMTNHLTGGPPVPLLPRVL